MSTRDADDRLLAEQIEYLRPYVLGRRPHTEIGRGCEVPAGKLPSDDSQPRLLVADDGRTVARQAVPPTDSWSASLGLWCTCRASDVLSVLVDKLPNLLASAAAVWPGVPYGPAKADIVARDLVAVRLSPQVLNVSLLDPEVA